MDVIDERELKNLLRSRPPAAVLISTVIAKVLDDTLPWEERRPYWHFLRQTGRSATLLAALTQGLKARVRVPLDVLIELCADITPPPLVVRALTKGLRKQQAMEELLGATAWDKAQPLFEGVRAQLRAQRRARQREYKDGLLEKFEFLRGQRMLDQAGRVLRRMLELYPDEEAFARLADGFREERAREVLSQVKTRDRDREKFERTITETSTSDREMLKCFLEEGLKLVVENRGRAQALSLALFFLDDYAGAEEALRWAEPSAAVDWMRAEVLFGGRRFAECLELVGHLEIKYASDPESTFAAGYARARCLRELGQDGAALDVMKSIVRIRPTYRSAHQLILEWTEGADWE